MAVFVLLERISPGLTNQNTFNSVHAMNYEIIVLLCCWLEVIKWMQQSIPAKVLPIKSCGGFFSLDRISDLGGLHLLKMAKGLHISHVFSAWYKSCDPTVNWNLLEEMYFRLLQEAKNGEKYIVKSVHFKKTVAQSSFLSKLW